ncbi:MAG: anti-sigma factor [Burkholderiales bacterium]|nr:MAG: anti-sigma factor [Burkholderiales bacterium]
MTDRPMDDAQLHAYVDGALSDAERAAVEAHLAAHPDDAARVSAYRAQNQALHRAFDAVLDEPHSIGIDTGGRASGPRWRWAAALAATFIGGAVLGALLHAGWQDQRAGVAAVAIARQAALAHVAYVPEVRHPVEVAASDEQHLVTWLSKRLDAQVRAPSLLSAGYQLLGGRLLPPAGEAGQAPVALFMYENAQGRRLSLLVRREPSGSDTAFRFARQGATNVFYWVDGPLGYALAGEIGRDELSSVARDVYRQLNP